MIDQKILTNPIILGILACVVTYLIMYWQERQRHKKNPKTKKREINIMIPGIVGCLIWFAAGSYFDNTDKESIEKQENNKSMLPKNAIVAKYDEKVILSSEGGSQSGSGSDVESYRLVGKGKIQLPHQEVFLDLANW